MFSPEDLTLTSVWRPHHSSQFPFPFLWTLLGSSVVKQTGSQETWVLVSVLPLTSCVIDPFVYCVTIFRNLLSQCLGHRRHLWIHDDGSWPPPMPRLGEMCHPHPPNGLHCLTSFKFTPTQPVFPNWALLSLTEAPSQQGEHKGAKSRQTPLLTVEGSNTMYFGGLCKN